MKVTAFLVFISILLMVVLNLEEVESRCYPNGCSIPGNLPFFYKRHFRPACNKHDVCYACGVRNGWPRSDCDKAFYQDMYMLCRHVSSNKRGFCRATARVYYRAVSRFGSSYYPSSSLGWCKYCPRSNGDPNAVLSPHARR